MIAFRSGQCWPRGISKCAPFAPYVDLRRKLWSICFSNAPSLELFGLPLILPLKLTNCYYLTLRSRLRNGC
ncbi:hypothetical protein DITRI_Ditri09bG0085800 [Diplodiscus trichospermus]